MAYVVMASFQESADGPSSHGWLGTRVNGSARALVPLRQAHVFATIELAEMAVEQFSRDYQGCAPICVITPEL
jgi:hypothetical protein